MLRQTVDNRAPTLLFPSFFPLTVTFPKLSVVFHSLYFCFSVQPPLRIYGTVPEYYRMSSEAV
jgi:hypothetical protein